ncbi:MAG: hypothetical protein J5525_12455 [Lachnospiraceae bacterium]|nr:hypothetical protein [Lachnospiraceae bacterium]
MNFENEYADKVRFCPYCGDIITTHTADGKIICRNENCQAHFFVFESKDSLRELCEVEDF